MINELGIALSRFVRRNRAGLLALALAPLVSAGIARAEWLSPILPLDADLGRLPLLDVALIGGDDEEAGRAACKVWEAAATALRNTLKSASRSRRLEVLARLVPLDAKIAWYYGTLARAADTKADVAATAAGKGGKARVELGALARAYGAAAAANAATAGMVYEALRVLYASGDAVPLAPTLRPLVTKLGGEAKARARLLLALIDLESGDPAAIARGRATLAQLTGAGREARIVAALALARDLAGFSAAGTRRELARPGFAMALAKLGALAPGLDDEDRDAVLATAVGIWRGAVLEAESWRAPPFAVAPFGNGSTALAFEERLALEDWQSKAPDAAIARYVRVAAKAGGESAASRGLLGKRVIALAAIRAGEQTDPLPFERLLLSLRADAVRNGYATELARAHRQLVDRELTAARVPTVTPAVRARTVAIVARYIAASPAAAARAEELLVSTAEIHALGKDPAEAVKTYVAILGKFKTSRRLVTYAETAAALQRPLARWPAEGLWTAAIPAGPAAERETLLRLNRVLIALKSPAVDWTLLTQAGQLELALGRQEAAFALWSKGLAAKPESGDAACAAGLMLTAFRATARWTPLEALSRLALRAKLAPLIRAKPVDASEHLATALLEGGKVLAARNEAAGAAAKLGEFTKSFAGDARRHEALYLLAEADKTLGKFRARIDALTTLTQEYPRSLYFKAALLKGGEGALGMGLEARAIGFYEPFAAAFPFDVETPAIRGTLIRLEVALQRYGEIGRLAEAQVRAANATPVQKLAAAKESLRIEELHGDEAGALTAAQRLLKVANDDASRALGLSALARIHFARRDAVQLGVVEADLGRLESRSFTVQEAVGETRLFAADLDASRDAPKIIGLVQGATGQGLVQGTERLGLKALEATASMHAGLKNRYDRVCQVGATGFCGPAMFKLARLTDGVIGAVRDLELPERFNDEVILKAFVDRKTALLETLQQQRDQAQAAALASAADGRSAPELVAEIYGTSRQSWQVELRTAPFVQWRFEAATAQVTH